MSQIREDNTNAAADESAETQAPRRRLGRWTRVLLAASVALMITGLILGARGDEERAGDPSRSPSVARPFAATPSTDPANGEADAVTDWSGPLFRLGFSFAVGFCLAFALRAVFKLAIVFIGLMVLTLFGLQYAEVVNIEPLDSAGGM